MQALLSLNVKAAIAHAVAFTAVLVFYLIWKNSRPHTVAQTFRYTLPEADELGVGKCNSDPQNDVGTGQCTTDYAYAPPKKTFRFNIIYGVLAFFAITAFAHTFYATDGFGSGAYSKVIGEGWNPYRWYEYGASASIMSVLIGYALGVRDGGQLISLGVVTAGMQASGYVVEASLRGTPNKAVIQGATTSGWLAFLALWVPIIYSFTSLFLDVEGKYKNEIDPQTGKRVRVPSWVWFIVLVQLYHYAGFGVVQAKQIHAAFKGIPQVFTAVERKYLILSFTAKLSLALGLGYGLLLRTRNCPL